MYALRFISFAFFESFVSSFRSAKSSELFGRSSKIKFFFQFGIEKKKRIGANLAS